MASPGQNLELDPSTGDYVIVNGRPVEDNTLNTPSYIRLKASRNSWLFAPDDQWGSDFYLFHVRHLIQNDQALLSVGARALQPLIDDGRASAVQITQDGSSDSAFQLTANVTQANSQTTPVTLTPVTN